MAIVGSDGEFITLDKGRLFVGPYLRFIRPVWLDLRRMSLFFVELIKRVEPSARHLFEELSEK